MDFVKLLLTFEGRINRQPYWIATAILFGVGFVASFIPVIQLLFPLLAIYSYVCIYNKRLHDLGRAGAWQLVMWLTSTVAFIAGLVMFVPLIMQLVRGVHDDEAVLAAMLTSGGAIGLLLLSGLISLVFHISIGIPAGQRGSNRFGPDPLNPVDTEVF